MMFDGASSLFGAFAATARRRPRAPALTFLAAGRPAVSYTYEQLFERTAAIAARLDASGPRSDAPVGILLSSPEAQTLHYLALLSRRRLPAILTPPNRKFQREYYLRTIRRVLETSAFSAVVSDVAIEHSPAPLLWPDTLDVRDRGAPASSRDAGAEPPPHAAFVQFSSGTTGIKRGVIVSAAAALAQIEAYAAAIELTPDDRILSWLPLYHDMGFMTALNMALARGVHAIMIPALDWVADPGLYIRAVSDYRATLSWHPNFAFAFMADRVREEDAARADLSSLRALVNCSEPVTLESQERFAARFASRNLRSDVFWGCYAMAETTFAVTHGTSRDPGYLDTVGPLACGGHPPAARTFVSVGRPIAGAALAVMRHDGTGCAEREPGELWVKSAFTFDAYYRDPEATRAARHGDWYKTGDIGYRAGSEYFVCGRLKDMLIVGGVNIYPQDVEEVVSGVPGVHAGRVAAFAIFDASAQTERIAVLAEADDAEGDRTGLVITIRQILTSAFQVTGFDVHLVAPGWLVKSSAGKIARGLTREKWLTEHP